MQINKYLVNDLKALGLWTEEIRNDIKHSEGSIQDIAAIPQQLKELYRTVWEIPMKSLIDMAAARGAFIDQAQSLNLFMESPTIGKVSSMYMHAWKMGVKTTYYLRSRPATKIQKTTTKNAVASVMPGVAADAMMDATAVHNAKVAAANAAAIEAAAPKKVYSDEEAITCSIHNPEACEACQ